MRWLLLLLALIVGIPYSQQHRQDKKDQAKREQTGTEKRPFVVKIAPTTKIEAEAKQEKEDRDAKQRSEERKEANDNKLTQFTGDVADYTDRLFWIGLIQAVILLLTWIFIWRQETATKTIERAYVKMSHSPPGLRVSDSGDKVGLAVEVKNYGRTPARVTDAMLSAKALEKGVPLPDQPEYVRGKADEMVKAFLVEGDSFTFATSFDIKTDRLGEVREGTRKLYIYGYVDYIDKFNVRHRAGYGRSYDPSRDDPDMPPSLKAIRNNLVFVGHEGYNYDRKRKRNEGNDWN